MDAFQLDARTAAAAARHKARVPASRDLTAGTTTVRDFSGHACYTLESTRTTTWEPHLFGKTHRTPSFRSGACKHVACKGRAACLRMPAGQRAVLDAAVPPSSLRKAASIGHRGAAGVSKRGPATPWATREVRRRVVLPLEMPPLQSIHPLSNKFETDLERLFGGAFDPYGSNALDEAGIAASFGK